MNPHLGASAKAINNATRKIYDGNFICNFRAVKDLHSTVRTLRKKLGRAESKIATARKRSCVGLGRNPFAHSDGLVTSFAKPNHAWALARGAAGASQGQRDSGWPWEGGG